MADTRRDFIKKATMLTGAAGLFSVLPASIQKALAIDAEKGTTFMDAEHVVFLMQENRSFDHCYGTLQGVRGFDDPRAVRQPNNNKVWAQTNNKGETYIPFNLDIKNSNATWMQSLPHSRENQVDAHNGGKMDKWLDSKRSGNKDYANMPLTLGFYDRKDIPFYYAFADAFTVCDQHFCSSLTGTSSNRSYFWAGTVREKPDVNSLALVYNDEINYRDLTATTFPERLEEAGISWKVYQNEVSIDVGFEGEQDDWLGNFTDNNLEFYKNYNIRLHKPHLQYMAKAEAALASEVKALQATPPTEETAKKLKEKTEKLEKIKKYRAEWTMEKFDGLSDFEKAIHQKAFVTNVADPHYHELETLTYDDNGTPREVKVPKGDVLFQFRDDVNKGQLPTVSWLAAPSNFSDHPTSPWYGAWYVSEVLDILTKNPEVWKKTILILTYDENDGYFDHVAPFVPPHTDRPSTGKASAGLNTAVEHVTADEEVRRGKPKKYRRESPIGLGFRVPMVVASPWTKGGWVNSQVFDHTSCLQFLETFINKKTGKTLHESNISDWRRVVCGDLTSVFRPYNGEKINYPQSLDRNQTIEGIHKAKFKPLPGNFKALSADDIKTINTQPKALAGYPKQEKGSRPSCALPYWLDADAIVKDDKVVLRLSPGDKVGAPFNVSAGVPYTDAGQTDAMRNWAFAVKAGDILSYEWPIANFEGGLYHLEVHGPNGFYRQFKGDKDQTGLMVKLGRGTDGAAAFWLKNNAGHAITVNIADESYHQKGQSATLKPGDTKECRFNLNKSHHWYDFSIGIKGNSTFMQRYAGRVENGEHSYTDPLIGA